MSDKKRVFPAAVAEVHHSPSAKRRRLARVSGSVVSGLSSKKTESLDVQVFIDSMQENYGPCQFYWDLLLLGPTLFLRIRRASSYGRVSFHVGQRPTLCSMG